MLGFQNHFDILYVSVHEVPFQCIFVNISGHMCHLKCFIETTHSQFAPESKPLVEELQHTSMKLTDKEFLQIQSTNIAKKMY